MIKNFFKKQKSSQINLSHKSNSQQVLFYNTPAAKWTEQNYLSFSLEGYSKNVIAYRCVNLISKSASFIPFKLQYHEEDGNVLSIKSCTILTLINTYLNSITMDAVYSYLLLSGNIYLKISKDAQGKPIKIEALQPNTVQVLTNSQGETLGYRYTVTNSAPEDFFINFSGECDILQIKNFHPINPNYGLSAFEPARFAIDQHNELSRYNKSLMQNSARPSGALVVNATQYNNGGILTQDQFDRLKHQLDEDFSGASNAGKPLLLEGGLDWKEMSISPKDMDFIENKHTAAREIALAFGVPPQLLGIPGDNTYSNMLEARLALWEQTIIPMINLVTQGISEWLKTHSASLKNQKLMAFDNISTPKEIAIKPENLELIFDQNAIATLSSRRDSEWNRIATATFLTDEEKRKLLGID